MKKYLIWFFIFLFLFSCKNETGPLEYFDVDAEPDLIVYGYSGTATSGSRKLMDTTAVRAEYYEKQRRVLMEQVSARFYNGEEVQASIEADRGMIFQDTQSMEARSNVRLIASDGSIMYTSFIFWDQSRDMITTEAFVRIIRPNGDVITGYGFEAPPDLSEITIKHRVQGSFSKEDDDVF